ncbi:hypothetical protein KA068_01780 [Candidatus Saccharibacteria bacterium]|nr:hypothetical protein [Candidatus Saccharibacteria bacterium]
MKLNKSILLGYSLLITLPLLLATSLRQAYAASLVWDGGGSDELFSNALNWSGDVAPVNGDSISIPYDVIFAGACSADVTLTNDLDANTVTLAGVQFTNTRPDNCYSRVVIAGNIIKLSGDVISSVIAFLPAARIESGLTVTAPITIQDISVTGPFAIGSNDVTVLNSKLIDISGSGDITVDGHEPIEAKGGGDCSPVAVPSPFSGDGSGFSGSIKVQSDGAVSIVKQISDVSRHASSIIKEVDGNLAFQLDNEQDMSIGTSMTFKGGSVSANQLGDASCNPSSTPRTITLSGDIIFTADTDFSLIDANIKFSGAVTGKEFVKVASGGNGTITFPDNTSISSGLKVTIIDGSTINCYQYTTQANNKTVVNADCSGEIGRVVEYPAEFQGILGGTGKVGHIKILSGGVLAPGNSAGCLSTGNLTMTSGSVYDFEVGGTTECSEYDQIKVGGVVDLGNGTLNLVHYGGFKTNKGQSFKVVDNDGSDAVIGTFKDLAEGATLSVDGAIFKITYVGGDGNDVVLTVISASTPNTGSYPLINSPALLVVIAGSTAALVIRSKNKFWAGRASRSKRP